jgi:predicted  nucleic acid-binding Zn-ribbon protein
LAAADRRAGDRSPHLGEARFEPDELEYVARFDQFRIFDSVDDEDIERRIRDKDDRLYELVSDEVEALVDDRREFLAIGSNVRGGLMSYFTSEHDERMQKIRQAVSLYIEHHGLVNTVSEIEGAVDAANEAAATRAEVEAAIESEFEQLSGQLQGSLRQQEQALRAEMERVATAAREGNDGNGGSEEMARELSKIREQLDDLDETRATELNELSDRATELRQLQRRLETELEELEQAREQASEATIEAVREGATRVVDEELETLQERRSQLAAELDRLERERERLEATGDRLDGEFSSLSSRVEDVEHDVADVSGTIEDVAAAVAVGDDRTGDHQVPAPLARAWEFDYVGRVDTSVRNRTTVALPGGDAFDIPEGYWLDDDRAEITDERETMARELEKVTDPDPPSVDAYPVRRRARYRFAESGGLLSGGTTRLVVEARCVSHLHAYARNGWDAAPAGLTDLLEEVDRALHDVTTTDVPHVVALASPTGWTDRVREKLLDEEYARTQFDRRLGVCLVDLRTGELIYDGADELVAANIGLFERPVDEERVDECEETLREEYVEDPLEDYVELTAFAREFGYEPHVVDRAFDRLVEAGEGVKRYQSIGLVLDLKPSP